MPRVADKLPPHPEALPAAGDPPSFKLTVAMMRELQWADPFIQSIAHNVLFGMGEPSAPGFAWEAERC